MAFMVHEHEKPILEQFRGVMGDLVEDERTLVRFLRARNLDIKKAENMLRKSVEWRGDKEIEAIKKWDIPGPVVKDFKVYYCGLDSDKRPVYLMPIGRWDGRKILGQGYKDDGVRFMYKTLEMIMDQCRQLGVTQFRVIVDYAELSFWKVAHWDSIDNVIRVVKDFEANYPETLFTAHFVNAPSVFWQAFKAVKPLLAQNTMDKIHIFDSDKKKWSAHLLELIPKEAIPKDYGGVGQATELHPI
ncbi:SEC14-like protein 2 [Orchesella cincta]|uniref:SEC14-like protein 2 n=1 Tax=Orchesella cincta TaxID=48709 RepID=A0A1D2NIK6_ORCCI|nr:SEC14-like protein 2 [Orchesella cincta]